VVTAVRYYEQFQEMPKCIVVGVFDEKLEDVAVIDEVGRPMNESARYLIPIIYKSDYLIN